MDKAARAGIRIADLLDREVFEEKLARNLEEKNRLLEKMYDTEGFKIEDILDEYYEYGQQVKKYVVDTSVVLNDALDEGRRVLLKGHKALCLISIKGHIRS